jgi:thiamine biosynthesis lipoprotein ApbE
VPYRRRREEEEEEEEEEEKEDSQQYTHLLDPRTTSPDTHHTARRTMSQLEKGSF